MRKSIMMFIAVIGNALGTAIMVKTNLGLSVWGSVAFSVKEFLGLGLGVTFLLISVLFYVVAVIINRKFDLKACVESFSFALAFGVFADYFLLIIPSFETAGIIARALINFIGLSVLMFAIACHLNVNRAVHPMDVYLDSVQKATNSVIKGTYIAYFSAFILTIVFSILNHHVSGIGLGTVFTLTIAGFMLDFYDKKVIPRYFTK